MRQKWGDPGPGPTDTASTAVRFLSNNLPRVFWLITLVPRLLMGTIWMRRIAKLGLAHALYELDFSELKTSDTLFVLATGASINGYDDTRWRVIEQHDSIGMNWFMLHDFVPDLYVMEMIQRDHRQLLSMRAEDYRDVPIILKSHLTNLSPRRLGQRLEKLRKIPPHIRDRFYLSLDVLAAGTDLSQTYGAYKVMRKAGFFKPKPRFRLLTKRRGSITFIINLAVRIGYTRIVLCGVDLNHSEYFYDSRRDTLEVDGFPVPMNPNMGKVHDTNDAAIHPVTVHEVIMAIHETVLDPAGIQLYVGDWSSALYPDFPEFPWQDAS